MKASEEERMPGRILVVAKHQMKTFSSTKIARGTYAESECDWQHFTRLFWDETL